MHKWFDSLMYISSGYVLDMFSDIRIPLNVVWYLVYNEYIAHDTLQVTFEQIMPPCVICACVCVCVIVCIGVSGFRMHKWFDLLMHITVPVCWITLSYSFGNWFLLFLTHAYNWHNVMSLVCIHNVLFTYRYSSGVKSMAHISLHVLFSTIGAYIMKHAGQVERV